MFFLTALAMAAASAPQVAKSIDCRPMLTLMTHERDVSEAARAAAQRRNDARQRPQRRCITLASA